MKTVSNFTTIPPPARLPIMGTASAHMMVKVGGELGLPPSEVLADTGLIMEELNDHTRTIRMDEELTLARNIVGRLGDLPALGMMFALHYRVSLYGSLGWGMLSSPTGRDALNLGHQFLDLSYACCAMSPYEEDGQYRIIVDGRELPEDIREFFVQRSVMALVRLLRDLLPGDGWLHWVSFTTPEPAHPQRFRELLQTPVFFGQGLTQVAVDAKAVDRPLPMANELALKAARAQCARLLAHRRQRVGVSGSVREFLAQTMPDLPNIIQAAKAMGLSERTLRRRLAEEGTSFKEVMDQSRRALAEDLLQRGMAPSQVARRIGYTEPAAFSHAFRRWNGVAPSEYVLGGPAGVLVTGAEEVA